jgi:hypothetical protein
MHTCTTADLHGAPAVVSAGGLAGEDRVQRLFLPLLRR